MDIIINYVQHWKSVNYFLCWIFIKTKKYIPKSRKSSYQRKNQGEVEPQAITKQKE